jgi:hypothetical protein
VPSIREVVEEMDTPTKKFSEMSLPELFRHLRSIDPDYLASISESEMSAAQKRSEAAQSSVIGFMRKPWVVFLYSFVIVYLVGVSNLARPMPFYPVDLRSFLILGFWSLSAFCLSGIIYLVLKALSELTGMDKGAWVTNQLRIVSLSSSVRIKCKVLAEKYPECAQYQLQLLVRGRELRLLDLGVMVYLSNTGQFLRRSAAS